MQYRWNVRRFSALGLLTLASFLAAATAQAQAVRFLGSITAISGNTVTVKTDAGDVHPVQIPETAVLKRIAPGERDLSKAEPLTLSGLAVGDRVLVTLDPNATGGVPQAARIIAIKAADVVQRQAAEQAAWNQGVHGLVKSVDAATGAIVVTERMGLVTKAVTVNTTPATVLKRYAPGSVRFDEAQPAPISAIKPGDQIWARGTRNADGSVMSADHIVSGSFRSIPGTVISTDTNASTLTVKDLTTKKPVTVRISGDAQLRQLDERIATVIAARLKGNAAGGASGGQGGGQRSFRQTGGSSSGAHSFNQAGGGRMDLETLLERAPEIKLSGLKKGDAVMLVATQDASGLSAVKLLAGVEPLLEAPQAQDLLSSWSLGSGESEAAQ